MKDTMAPLFFRYRELFCAMVDRPLFSLLFSFD